MLYASEQQWISIVAWYTGITQKYSLSLFPPPYRRTTPHTAPHLLLQLFVIKLITVLIWRVIVLLLQLQQVFTEAFAGDWKKHLFRNNAESLSGINDFWHTVSQLINILLSALVWADSVFFPSFAIYKDQGSKVLLLVYIFTVLSRLHVLTRWWHVCVSCTPSQPQFLAGDFSHVASKRQR